MGNKVIDYHRDKHLSLVLAWEAYTDKRKYLEREAAERIKKEVLPERRLLSQLWNEAIVVHGMKVAEVCRATGVNRVTVMKYANMHEIEESK